MSATTEAPRVQAGYEVANALGRLNADRQLLGARCMEEVVIAKSIRYVLFALDLYAQATGRTAAQVARDVRKGRVEVRMNGSRMTVVTP
jgi:hypothetical protein